MMQMAETYVDFFRTVVYDCSMDEKLCPKDDPPQLPIIDGHQPAGLNPYTGKPLIHRREFKGGPNGEVNNKTLSKFILDNMPFLGETLKEKN